MTLDWSGGRKQGMELAPQGVLTHRRIAMVPPLAQSYACVVCHGPLNPLRRYRRDGARGRAVFGGAHVSRCAECLLVQVTPLPSATRLEEYYTQVYRSGGRHGAREADLSTFPRDNLFYWHRGESVVDLVSPHLANPADHPLRVLDVGAGFGHTLAAVAERYPTASREALEISDVCVAHLRASGVTVHAETVEAWAESESRTASFSGGYDLIILSHVLEHVRDPRRVLTLLGSRLRPGGLLFLEVRHVPLEMLGKYPDHPWAPRWDEPHLTFFSRSSLTYLVHMTGFAPVHHGAAGPAYRPISALRYRTPPLRSVALRALSSPLVRFLRRRTVARPLQTFAAREPFYRSAPDGIWLRSLLRRPS